MKRQCDFNSEGKGFRCPNDATCKWGEHWFCDYHGSRKCNIPMKPLALLLAALLLCSCAEDRTTGRKYLISPFAAIVPGDYGY